MAPQIFNPTLFLIKSLFIFVLVFALGGCAGVTITSEGTSANLEKTKIIRCLKWETCFLSANELCPAGYSVLNESDRIGKKLEVACTEAPFVKKSPQNPVKKMQETNTSAPNKKVPASEKPQGNQQIEKIMDLKP